MIKIKLNNKFETVYVTEDYFKENSELIKILDPMNFEKQSRRCYLFLKVEYEGNNLLVPMRSNLNGEIRKYGRIGHSVPSLEKPNAGLDYRYILIINDDNFLEIPEYCKIPGSQQFILNSEIDKIKYEVKAYIDGYVRVAIKNRHEREPKFKESCLINFHNELKIEEKRIQKDKEKRERKLKKLKEK